MLSEKRVKQLCFVMAGLFMVIHVGMFLLFSKYQITPLVWENAFSILFYVGMILLIRFGKLKAFVISTFLEITIHMGLAVYFTGWGGGFQICLIGICVLLFYAEYVGRSLKMDTVRSIFLAPAAALVYLASLIVSKLRPAQYALPEQIETGMQIFWALVVFVIMLGILQIFLFVAIRSQEELSSEAMHDKLTGLPNRYHMASVFPKIMSRNSWLAIADLDDFKHMNDTFGHNCGDIILKTVAEILRRQEGIEVCRWGGEEFLIAGVKKDEGILQDLHHRIEEYPFEYQGTKLNVTVTIGAARYQEGQSIDEWINAADEKLYEGKKQGKNRVCF
ncbi:MAG: GGDEF domain-containing protein [Clostridia bacterium]|nr:GGDEF domain-containing protein [Clostridia bacterium]